jgi:hypothetical protein
LAGPLRFGFFGVEALAGGFLGVVRLAGLLSVRLDFFAGAAPFFLPSDLPLALVVGFFLTVSFEDFALVPVGRAGVAAGFFWVLVAAGFSDGAVEAAAAAGSGAGVAGGAVVLDGAGGAGGAVCWAIA